VQSVNCNRLPVRISRDTLQIDGGSSPSRNDYGRQDHSGRMYDIKSLDVATFKRSQNFLARYRLWALIEHIILTDPRKTPVEDRTIDWLVDKYLARYKKGDFRHDVERNQRHPRHIPRAEIIGLFAAHAEWILAQHLATTSNAVRKLNIPSWIQFCRRVKSARKAAMSENVRWGLAYGVDSDEDDEGERDRDQDDRGDIDLSPFGQTREFWNKKIKAATARKVIRKHVRKLSILFILPVPINYRLKYLHAILQRDPSSSANLRNSNTTRNSQYLPRPLLLKLTQISHIRETLHPESPHSVCMHQRYRQGASSGNVPDANMLLISLT
jgi:hypothetical protein